MGARICRTQSGCTCSASRDGAKGDSLVEVRLALKWLREHKCPWDLITLWRSRSDQAAGEHSSGRGSIARGA
jgi:hypothetical protein